MADLRWATREPVSFFAMGSEIHVNIRIRPWSLVQIEKPRNTNITFGHLVRYVGASSQDMPVLICCDFPKRTVEHFSSGLCRGVDKRFQVEVCYGPRYGNIHREISRRQPHQLVDAQSPSII